MISHSKPTISSDDIENVRRFLLENKLASGSATLRFSNKLTKFFGAEDTILTSSGTSAIVEALRLLNIKKGYNVIIPAYVCSNVARAIIALDLRPLVVDINEDDYNISYKEVFKKINNKTKAIVLPHMFGNPVRDIEKFCKLDIPIIEDVAQAIGGRFKSKRLGSFGDVAVCSFYATKMLTTGEGGALIIKNKKLSKLFGADNYFYKMPDTQSILGVGQLNSLNEFIKKRRYISNLYYNELNNLKSCSVFKTKDSAYYRFVIKVDNKRQKSTVNELRNRGIGASFFSDLVFNYLKLNERDYPNTADALNKIVSLPIYPSLTEKDINHIMKTLKEVLV